MKQSLKSLLIAILAMLLLSACGSGKVVTLPSEEAVDQSLDLDHFRIIVPAVIESGYEKFEISVIAENRSGNALLDYQGDWPEAYIFLIVPGWKSFVPIIEGDLNAGGWVNGTATLSCHFRRGVFYEEVGPVQGYWTLSLEENGLLITGNSYTPWIVEIQGRVYW